jgi:hypothetical protein
LILNPPYNYFWTTWYSRFYGHGGMGRLAN